MNRRTFLKFALYAGATALLGSYTVLIERNIVLVNRYKIPIANLPPSLSLVLSGHTHGGQVVVPFLGPPVLPVKNKDYSSGLISTPRTQLFISRGIGWAIYLVRFNCYPEIAVLELVSPKLIVSAGWSLPEKIGGVRKVQRFTWPVRPAAYPGTSA